MITTRLQTFTHGRQARLLSSGGLLVQSVPRPPLLACACEKFFHVLEVNDIGTVDVVDVIDRDPLTPIDSLGKVEDADGNPFAPRSWQRCSRRC